MKKEGKENFGFNSLKFVPKAYTSIAFFLLLGAVLFLFWGRKSESFRSDFLLEVMPEFYQHISNFTISYLLYAGIGYFWLMMGIRFKYIIFFGIAFVLANFIYELFIPILNTPDIIDAYFGFAGTILGFFFLFFVKKYGLVINAKLK
ncbi:hypothetical protein EI546_15180 [Aequorivita sp. H23M31]|uniref:VanZ-like domain-containing protein n=1 Tax=Aequorivita ciconiae TaxID=2494375 RepID=A0A410G6R9_9FLAO|nr:hypothetical protein [Aequorivita sp. H23M31]QAA82977.1 hypothetical protein EI546_15180 [Aequorivita sp. H23M31]